MSEGGLYAFQIRAREILEDETGFGDEVTTNVTLVITDVDDRIPTFNRNNYTVAVPEDVGELALYLLWLFLSITRITIQLSYYWDYMLVWLEVMTL